MGRISFAKWPAVLLACFVCCSSLFGRDAEHAPLAIRFRLKEPGFVTLVINDAQGKRVRNLLSETEFSAGDNVAYWDGLDDLGRDPDAAKHAVYYIPGKLVAAGEYQVEGLVRPRLDLRYDMTVYTHGNPPWKTTDRASEWLGNHTPHNGVLFIPEGLAPERPGKPDSKGGQILVSSFVSEGGSGLAWLDLEGNKQHGQLWVGGVWTGATHLTRDKGKKRVEGVYAYTGSAWDDELRLYELVTGTNKMAAPRDKRFGTGEDRPVLNPKWKFPRGTKFHDRLPQLGLGGLAVHDGLLVASLPTLNQLLLVDARQHRELGVVAMADPRGVAFTPEGELLVLSGTKLLKMKTTPGAASLLGGETTLVAAGLEDPRQLTVDDQSVIYIGDWGNSHQVKVFDSHGKHLRNIGVAGKPKTGPYNAKHMNRPHGLTIDSRGRLWVAEADWAPKRVSVWSLAGKFLQAFYGPPQYGGGGELDPEDPSLFYYASQYTGTGDVQSGLTMRLDKRRRTFEIEDVYFRSDDDDSRLPIKSYVNLAPQTPIRMKGRKYLTGVFSTNPTGPGSVAAIWELERGVAKARAAFGRAREWELLTNEFKARVPAGLKLNDAVFTWSDLNGNGVAEAEEVTVAKGEIRRSVTVARDLSILTGNGEPYRPVSFANSGAPLYDLNKREVLVVGAQDTVSSGGGEVVLGEKGWSVFTTAPRPFSGHGVGGVKDGVPMWSYPSLWHGLHASHNAPMPEFPGELIGTTRVIGYPVKVPSLGEVWAINGNKGNIYLFTMDGLFVATLFKDGRLKAWDFPKDERGMLVNDASLHEESFWPFMTQTKNGEIWLSVHNSCLVQVLGLEKSRRLPSQKLKVTKEDLQACQAWFVLAEGERQARQAQQVRPLTVSLTKTAPEVDGKLDEWLTNQLVTIDSRTQQVGDWGKKKIQTKAGLAVAGGRLYAVYQTWDDKLLNNRADSLPLLFKTGGALDLMLDFVPGGQRLLVTRVNGKTTAVLYRPQTKTPQGEPAEFTSPIRSLKFESVQDVSSTVSLASGTNGVYEFSIPLEVLGLKPEAGMELRGDLGILRGNGAQTLQRSYWHNKATGIVSDIPSEAELTPRLWGKLQFQAAE